MNRPRHNEIDGHTIFSIWAEPNGSRMAKNVFGARLGIGSTPRRSTHLAAINTPVRDKLFRKISGEGLAHLEKIGFY